ncbi:hypothetical protein GCWU000246_00686 [Jonquetella anthropi E3_33 E1]|nr:hypothetical protein GCWU000246_00686 [Jonquetella anthropi E3_33 E1]
MGAAKKKSHGPENKKVGVRGGTMRSSTIGEFFKRQNGLVVWTIKATLPEWGKMNF